MDRLTQRGVIPVALILWSLAGVAVVALSAGLIHTYNKGVRAEAQLADITLALRDCRKDTLAECVRELTENYDKCLETVEKQNRATLALREAERNATERAKTARQAATKAQLSTQAERARLSALQHGSAGANCQDAVKQVKRGLNP